MTRTASGQAEVVAGRFAVHRALKDGNGLRTLLVTDAEDGAERVLKVAKLARIPIGTRLRLQHEAEVLRRLDSPWVAGVIDSGISEGLLYILTPFVGGSTLADRLAAGPLATGDVLRVARCLFEALQHAHDHGVVHRDVKPPNIIVDASGFDRVVLVDFGLARSDTLDDSVRDLAVGTARYISPEQAGLLEGAVDERSDLYSAGVVLYECLAGRPPFEGERLTEVLRQHLASAPPDLAALGIKAPRALMEVVQRLLAKEPHDRYQAADAVLADLDAIRHALDRGEDEPTVLIGRRDRRRSLTHPAFVGRDAELAALGGALSAAGRGTCGLALLEAESGGGKTRLLDELAHRAVREGFRVLRGQGTDEAAQKPFEVLRGVAGAVVPDVAGDPQLGDRLRADLGERSDAVCAALPELSGVLQPAQGATAPEAFGEARTIAALEALLAAVGSPQAPALILLDDCQWADGLTVRLIERWHERCAAEGDGHVVVVVAFRSEEVGPRHPLRRLDEAEHHALAPLSPVDLRALLESMAGPLPPEAVDAVVGLSAGSPFMASAVLLGLVESGGLVAASTGWYVQAQALEAVTASRRAGAVLARRLSLLPGPARRLLEVGAALGKEFDLELATALLGPEGAEAGAALEEARRRHFIWVRGTAAVFVHDKLRESILDQLEEAERALVHHGAAEWLEGNAPERIFELAYHWGQTGHAARALPYALAAAEQARAQNALESAEQQYAIAESGADEADEATRQRVAEGQGDVFMLRGRYDEAAPRFTRALELARGDLDLARIQGKLGELAFKRGDVQSAKEAVEQALRALGCRVPSSRAGFLLAAVSEAVVQVLHTLLPRLFLGRRSPEGADREYVAIRLYSRLAHIYWFGSGRVPTGWAHLREMNLAERYPPSAELAQAYSEHAPVMTMIPAFGRGIAYAQRSLQIRRELGDLWGQGQSHHFLGVVLYGASRFSECIDSCREAVRLLQITGDHWEMNTAGWHIAFSLYRLGELTEAAEAAQRVHASGREIGDAQARRIGLAGWAKATGGRVPGDLIDVELREPGDDVHTTAEVAQAKALWLMAEGRPGEAVAVLGQSRAAVRKAGVRQEYVAPIAPWLATARRQEVETCPPWAVARRRRGLRAANRQAVGALRIARQYRNNLPHALRERALCCALLGRTRSARRFLDRSVAVAGELGMRHERALSLQTRGDLGAELGWATATEDQATARAEIAAITASLHPSEPVTMSLIDRFGTALEEGRRVATALDPVAVSAALRDAAQTLLRAERCLVLQLRDGHPVVADGEDGAGVSLTLVEQALESRGPVVLADLAHEVSESLVLADVRSALCCPIEVRGRVVACLYADHHRVAGLFGDDEERLALFLAALAGAALENAEGFGEIQALTRSLEGRVAERTAELAESNRQLDESLQQLQHAFQHEQQVSEQLRRLDQLKNEFLGMVAHDLRSPLTIVQGFALTLQTAWDTLEEDQKLVLMDRVVRNTRRLSEFVENLLQFGRIESGQFSYDMLPFDLAALVRRTADELASADPGVDLEIMLPPVLPQALGDEHRHWQVLTNLLSNAIKFSPEGAPVRVEVQRDGSELVVAVSDRGPGIRPEDVPRVFEKFSRIDQPDDRKRAVGTGLGLYICQSLVQAQGGRIWVSSEQGQGTTFHYTIGVADEQAATGANTPDRHRTAETPTRVAAQPGRHDG